MRLRGSTALEMIIVMIILLVVAGVIISLFLNVFGDITLPGPKPSDKFKEEVDRECNSLCADYKSGRDDLAGIDYCKKAYKFDFNQDKDFKDPFQTNTLLYACEESFYCPHMHKCELQAGEVLNIKKCKELLCASLEEKYTNANDPEPARAASEEILGIVKRGGCDFPITEPPQPDWFTSNYDVDVLGHDVCE